MHIQHYICSIIVLLFSLKVAAQNQVIAVKEINEQGVYGKLFYAENTKKAPAVIVVSGSDGGIEYASQYGESLATKGFTVFALAYWGYKDLPKKLSHIPLEYFYKALEILENEETVDKDRIGIIGYSRGGELALLLASRTEKIKAVVGLSAGAHVAPNIDFSNWWDLKSAWTDNGEEFYFLPKVRKTEKGNWKKAFAEIKSGRNRDSLIVDFNKIRKRDDFEKSAIKVEKIKAPILLISGGQDLSWASEAMGDYIINRLHQNDFKYFNTHLNFPLAGHDFVPLGFASDLSKDYLIKKYVEAEYKPGGRIEDNLSAGKKSWQFLIQFLKQYL